MQQTRADGACFSNNAGIGGQLLGYPSDVRVYRAQVRRTERSGLGNGLCDLQSLIGSAAMLISNCIIPDIIAMITM